MSSPPAPLKRFKKALMSRSPSGEAEALQELRGTWWHDQKIHHPIWALMDPTLLSPQAELRLFQTLLEGGMPLSFTEKDTHGAQKFSPRLLSNPRSRHETFRDKGVMFQCSLLSMALSFRSGRRQAWLEFLTERGAVPEEMSWRMAAFNGVPNVMAIWHKAGYAPENVGRLMRDALNASRGLTRVGNEVWPDLLKVMGDLGWRPNEEDVQTALDRGSTAALISMIAQDPSVVDHWPRQKLASCLIKMWQIEEGFDLTRQLMDRPGWRAAMMAPHRFDKKILPSETPLPCWVQLLHPRYTSSYPWEKAMAVWAALRAREGECMDYVDELTHGEVWALRGVVEPLKIKTWTGHSATAPNPRTGRWPVAGSVDPYFCQMRTWVAASGGWATIFAAENGPLAEMCARAVEHRDPGQCKILGEGLQQASCEALKGIYQGGTVEDWCASRRDLAKSWKERTGRKPYQGVAITAETVMASALAYAPALLKAHLANLSEDESVRLKQPQSSGLTIVEALLARSWEGDAGVRHRHGECLLLLLEAGVPLPQKAQAWTGWSQQWVKSGCYEGEPIYGVNRSETRPLAFWRRSQPWPAVLAKDWLEMLLNYAGARGIGLTRLDAIVSDGLATGSPGVAKDVLAMVLNPAQFCSLTRAHSSVPPSHIKTLALSLAAVLPAEDLLEFPLRKWGKIWQKMALVSSEPFQGLAQMWTESDLLGSLQLQAKMTSVVPSAPLSVPSIRRRF